MTLKSIFKEKAKTVIKGYFMSYCTNTFLLQSIATLAYFSESDLEQQSFFVNILFSSTLVLNIIVVFMCPC